MPLLRSGSNAWLGAGIAVGTVFIFVAILEVAGVSSSSVLVTLILGGWGSRTGIFESLVKAVPICLCALAAAVPARFGLTNIGGEGQLLAGAIGATGVAIAGLATPGGLLLVVMGTAAIISGALWGFVPGVLRAATRTSETVSSLLANYVAGLGLLYLVHGPWRDPDGFGWAQSLAFPEGARLPVWPGTRLHTIAAVAPVVAVLMALIFKYSTLGMTARIVSASEETARAVGLHPGALYVVAFAIGGTLAGLAGFGEVSGIQGRLREGVSLGYGFAGFLVAWLCRNRFEWIPLAALAMGGLVSAGDVLQISAGLPFATVNLLQGLILLAVVIHEATRRPATQRFAAARAEASGV